MSTSYWEIDFFFVKSSGSYKCFGAFAEYAPTTQATKGPERRVITNTGCELTGSSEVESRRRDADPLASGRLPSIRTRRTSAARCSGTAKRAGERHLTTFTGWDFHITNWNGC